MAAAKLFSRPENLGIDMNRDWDSMPPPPENMGIISDDDDLMMEEKPEEFEPGIDNVIVVDNLPQVSPEKYQKLMDVVKKIYNVVGKIDVENDGIMMPVDPLTKKSLGFCCIEYSSPREAEHARETTNWYKLDRSHIFNVNKFDDIEKYMKVPDAMKLDMPGSPYAISFQSGNSGSSSMKLMNMSIYSCGDTSLGCSCGDCPSSPACSSLEPSHPPENVSCLIRLGPFKVRVHKGDVLCHFYIRQCKCFGMYFGRLIFRVNLLTYACR